MAGDEGRGRKFRCQANAGNIGINPESRRRGRSPPSAMGMVGVWIPWSSLLRRKLWSNAGLTNG